LADSTVLSESILLYSFVSWKKEIELMGGVIAYIVILGGAFATAMGLYFGFKAIKLI